jgi:hypothetical protein
MLGSLASSLLYGLYGRLVSAMQERLAPFLPLQPGLCIYVCSVCPVGVGPSGLAVQKAAAACPSGFSFVAAFLYHVFRGHSIKLWLASGP